MDHSHINNLPEEVLQHVFSFLNVPDRLKVCIVCKRWLNAINCKYLLKDIVVQVDVLSEITEAIWSRKFFNFSFKSMLIYCEYYKFFKHISSTVEYISFKQCEIANIQMPFNGLSFENLKVFKMIDCEFWMLFPNLHNLTELYLSGKNTITDAGLAVLQGSMKNLKIFSLYCPINCDPKVYKRFYSSGHSYDISPSPHILSLPALKSFISERANTLKELNLYFNFNAYALKEISRIENLCLQKISLENAHNCISGLITLFENQSSLKSINLNGIIGLNNIIIKSICDLLPNIEEVYICNGSVTDDSFNNIFQLKKLKKLSIGNNYASDLGFFKAVQNFESTYLQYLNVCGLKVVNVDLLIYECKNLVQLNLSQCIISDAVLHFISEYLIHLQDLNLKKTDITDYGLTGASETGLSETNLLAVNQNPSRIYLLNKPLSNLKGLKHLQLNYCEKITDYGIALAIRFQHLEFLDLTGCHIKNRNTIDILLQENPSLRKLSQDYLRQIHISGDITEYPVVYRNVEWA